MSVDPKKFDLTDAERQTYRALRRDVPVTERDEDQTVAYRRRNGFVRDSHSRRIRVSRWIVATIAACAAGMLVAAGVMKQRQTARIQVPASQPAPARDST